MAAINKSGKVRARSYEGFSSHVRHGPELIYEINNIFFLCRFRASVAVGDATEKIRRQGWTSTGRGKTHKAAYVSSVMRTGDFSFRACECKRKMNVLPSFLPFGLSLVIAVCHRRPPIYLRVGGCVSGPSYHRCYGTTIGSMSFFPFNTRWRKNLVV